MSRLFSAVLIYTSCLSAPVWAGSGFPPVFQVGTVDGITGFRVPGLAAGDLSGFSVAKVGDMNGDQIDDFLISALEFGSSRGSAYVVFGKAGGLPQTFDLAALNGQNGFRAFTQTTYSDFGVSVSGAGDMNGDGLRDIIIGARTASPNGVQNAGSAYVIFGKSTGFAAQFDVANLNGSNGFRVDGLEANARAGDVVAALGDINHDGLGDVGINAPGAYPGGAVYLIFGKSSGFSPVVPAPAFSASNAENSYVQCTGGCNAVSGVGDFNGDHIDDFAVGLTTFDRVHVFLGAAGAYPKLLPESALLQNTVPFTGSSESPATNDLQSLSAAGDVNGDGFDDFIVGQPRTTVNGLTNAGRTSVVFGRPVTFPFADFLRLADLNGTDGFRIEGTKASASVGYSVAGLGDINGDGLGDIVSYTGPATAGTEHDASVVFGSKTAFAPAIDPASLDGTAGFRLGFSGAGVGPASLSAAGDVNHDGFGDLLAGAYSASPGGMSNAGETFVVYSHAPQTPKPIYGTDGDDVLIGTPNPDLMAGKLGNDIIEGGASGDTLYGDAGYDTLSYAHAASAVVVDFQNLALNTGDAANDHIEGFEALMGSVFADTLRADNNANTLTGLAGADTLWGRGGSDIFSYTQFSESPGGAGRDVIADFNPGTASTVVDRIDLSAIDANTCTCMPLNDAFKFIGTSPFSGVRGQLRLLANSTGAIVQADVNGDRAADLEIKLQNVTKLSNITAADFKL